MPRGTYPVFYVAGWYGTETAGDKLILLGIAQQIWAVNPKASIVLITSNIYYSVSSINELASLASSSGSHPELVSQLLNQVEVRGDFIVPRLGKGDILIFGGGPIMDDATLFLWLCWVKRLHRRGGVSGILGCGWGPLRLKLTRRWAQELVDAADGTILRQHSNMVTTTSLDPSFLTWPIIRHYRSDRRNGTAINIRFVPKQYGAPPAKNINQQITWLEDKLSWLQTIVPLSGVSIFSTHELDQEGDLKTTATLMSHFKKNVDMTPPTLHDILSLLGHSQFSIAMRYHGAIISLLMGCKVLGIDYNKGGGKLSFLYNDLGFSTPPASLFDGDSPNNYQIENWNTLDTETIEVSLISAEKTYQKLVESLVEKLKENITKPRIR
ncbi:hypothetical protein TH19_20300 [Thalassospira profundimaris]|uniref:Polysaccharide pyruvyl transferase domain-containing protein n=2 Tax=Thalassospira TaxID=168934 RepID=A0A367VZC0_9PROT|nr:hypothetical protein TH19_20300 [Thalassospira profundimaris]